MGKQKTNQYVKATGNEEFEPMTFQERLQYPPEAVSGGSTLQDPDTGQMYQYDYFSETWQPYDEKVAWVPQNVLTGGAKKSVSQYGNIGGMVTAGANALGHFFYGTDAKGRYAEYEANIAEAEHEAEVALAEGNIEAAQTAMDKAAKLRADYEREKSFDDWLSSQGDQSQAAVYDWVDGWDEAADKDIAAAKEPLGPVGDWPVDLGVRATQAGIDGVLSLPTSGSAWSTLITVRELSEVAKEARQAGASGWEQILAMLEEYGWDKLEDLVLGLSKNYGVDRPKNGSPLPYNHD